MLHPTPTDDVADADIVGWIQKRHGGAAIPHQPSKVFVLARVAAKNAMMPEVPKMPGLLTVAAVRRQSIARSSVTIRPSDI